MKERQYSFEKLVVWQKAKDLAKDIYLVTRNFPVEERFGMISQLRRSAVSVASNIAEGSARKSPKDQAHYSTQAYSSLMELLNQVILGYEFEYLDRHILMQLRSRVDDLATLLSRLRNAQQAKAK